MTDAEQQATDWFEKLRPTFEVGQYVRVVLNAECPLYENPGIPPARWGHEGRVNGFTGYINATRHSYDQTGHPYLVYFEGAARGDWLAAEELEPIEEPDPDRIAVPYLDSRRPYT